MKKITSFLLTICVIAASAQTPQTGDNDSLISIVDPSQKIEHHFNLANEYGQLYNDHESLCKSLEELDQASLVIYQLLQEEPENSFYQHYEAYLLYSYCHCLSQLTGYVDHTKMDDDAYAKLLRRQRQICNEVLVRATQEENRASNIWQYALAIAANTLGMELVNDQTKATPEALAAMIATFDTFVPNIASTEGLFILDTYIQLLLLNGDNDKAFQYIKEGCRIDGDHKDFVLLAGRDDYQNWRAKDRANMQLSLDQRVRELRTQFIGPEAADTKTVSFCKEKEKQAQKIKHSQIESPLPATKWALFPLKNYIAKYGAIPLEHITKNNSKEKVAVFLIEGDYVGDNFDFSVLHSAKINNPHKLNINKVHSDYTLIVVIKGNLVVKNIPPQYYLTPPAIIVEQNLYANQLTLDGDLILNVKGDIFVDELFRSNDHSTYTCRSLHCGLDLTPRHYLYEETEVTPHPIIQRFGSLVDETSVNCQREAFLHKIVFELLQAGLISPNGASLLGIKHQDSYAKYLESTSI